MAEQAAEARAEMMFERAEISSNTAETEQNSRRASVDRETALLVLCAGHLSSTARLYLFIIPIFQSVKCHSFFLMQSLSSGYLEKRLHRTVKFAD